MSHGLTIPDANKSPYPLQEPPHAPSPPVKVAKKQRDDDTSGSTGTSGRAVVIGAAIGLGALAVVAAVVGSRRAAD